MTICSPDHGWSTHARFSTCSRAATIDPRRFQSTRRAQDRWTLNFAGTIPADRVHRSRRHEQEISGRDLDAMQISSAVPAKCLAKFGLVGPDCKPANTLPPSAARITQASVLPRLPGTNMRACSSFGCTCSDRRSRASRNLMSRGNCGIPACRPSSSAPRSLTSRHNGHPS